MAAFYFFTNSAPIQPQTLQQKYGPVHGNETSQYRVTSLFSSSTVQKAYAVCKGKIFAQEVNGKINIVLKPTQQPTGIFAPVKYYIYKGLMKDFLVDSDEPDYIADVTKSDLTFKIKKSQNRRNAAFDKLKGNAPNTTTTLPGINSVGLKLTAAATSPHKLLDTAFLDEVFLRVDDDEFPSVDGGDDIGQFEYTNFGFEIVLDGLGEGPTLEVLRNTQTIITVNTSPVGDVNTFKEEDKREQILNYLDPCAFYSSFFFDGIQVKLDPMDAKFVSRDKENLYNDILAKFFTKDLVYLDLRNEHNHGLNYYRNYNVLPNSFAQLYINYDAGSSVLTDYQSYGWPILIVSTSAFTNTNVKMPSTIVLNLPQGDNPAPMIYRAQGYFYAGFKRMSQPPDIKETLRSYIGFRADTFTQPIALSIPKLANNITIPSYINLRYLKKISSLVPANPPVGELTLRAKHFLDNLFELTYLLDANGLKIPLDTDDITQWHVTGSTAVVDSSSGYGRDFMAKIGIGRDQSNIYFFAFTEAVNIATGSSSKTGFLPVLTKAHKTNIEFGYIEILDGNNVQQPMLTHNGLPDGILDASSSLGSLNADERSMIVLALDRDELPLVQNATSSLAQTFDKRLALRNKHNYLDSNGNVTGTEYDLFVIGYQFGTSVSVVAVNTQIKVRNKRATPRIFSSRDAAINSELLDPVSENRKHFINSKIAKGTTVRLRSSPWLPKSTEPSNLLCETQGDEHRITILGKKKIVGDNVEEDVNNPNILDRTWYYLEVLDPIVVTDASTNTTTILPKGMKAWAIADFYAVSTFENFIRDLIELNEDIDLLQFPAESLVERITRLRQHTKEAGDISVLFDAIIDAPAIPPPATVRLWDPAAYETGPIVTFESVTDLETKIQLFDDYMGALAGNGQIIDLHHLFIGMDAMNHVNLNTEVDLGLLHWLGVIVPKQYLGSNVNATTWAGDIGAIPGDYMVVPDNKPSAGADWRYQDYWRKKHPHASDDDRRKAFLQHYWETRAKDEDLFPDVYCHLIRERLVKYVLENPANRNVAALLYHFNLELTNEGDRHAFQVFARYLSLDPSNPLSYTKYPTVAARMKTDIYNFAVLWFYNKFHSTLITPYPQLIDSLSDRLTTEFLMWLDRRR